MPALRDWRAMALATPRQRCQPSAVPARRCQRLPRDFE